jgi:hypothetical protein
MPTLIAPAQEEMRAMARNNVEDADTPERRAADADSTNLVKRLKDNQPLSDTHVVRDDAMGEHREYGMRGAESTDEDDRMPKRGEPREPPAPEPGGTRGSDRGGSTGWGDAGSGGSVIDKRAPDKERGTP